MSNTAPRKSQLFRGTISALILMLALIFTSPVLCQESETVVSANATRESGLWNAVFDYLKMANQGSPTVFRPMTQKERNQDFGKSLINPIWYARGALSAGSNQMSDKPKEWEQGMSGYGKRFSDIMGQYAVRKTVMFGFESLLHEDNRYFGSGKKGFWPRTGYSLSSGFLARHDNGKRYPSASLLIGYASGAYFSRFWQPASADSAKDAARSFGISMGWNIGLGILKEYLPDMLRPLMRKKKP